MLKAFNEHFGLNRQQRNGLLVLLFISFLLLVARIALPAFVEPAPVVVKNIPLVPELRDSVRTGRPVKPGAKQILFAFDPNTVSEAQLVKLGFREKTARALIKFRGKGFRFREKGDLKKVYGVTDRLYASLEPYILIEKREHPVRTTAALREEKPLPAATPARQVVIELNSTDSAALLSLPGIGPVFARRIIKYRDMLGGFTDVSQLREVYGFSEESYLKVKSSVSTDPSRLRLIQVNADDFKTINRHPYLDYETTKRIFSRRRAGRLDETSVKEAIADDDLFVKVRPYLSFE